MSFPKITIATVVKLLVASLAVGFVLAWLNLTPTQVLAWARETLGDLVGNAAEYLQGGISYILLGAVIVVPLWLANYLWRAAHGKKGD